MTTPAMLGAIQALNHIADRLAETTPFDDLAQMARYFARKLEDESRSTGLSDAELKLEAIEEEEPAPEDPGRPGI